MKRKNLDDILHSARTGRAISPAGVRKAAVALMETMIPRMVDSDYEGREFWTITLFGFAKPVRERRNYWDGVGGMEKQAVLHEDMSGELFWMLASLHQWGSESVKRWMSLSVEDVMREAGLVSLYEEWFQKEAVMWETEYGKVPSVGDIMKITYELEWFEQRKVRPYMEQPKGYFPDHIAEPFRRTWRELGVNSTPSGRDMENAKQKYINLASTWIWLLMVEAPGRIYFNTLESGNNTV
ncbi:MAG: hypothetical protein K6G19_11190 [Lachnospiraceae bacterium]|nr:hypothetical protein [Lachnospiraceae bacterium]